jgi:small GTP-binding protein
MSEVDFLWKIVVVGESGVGKTNLMTRFAYNKFSKDHQSTIGVEFAAKIITLENKTIKAQIWDTAGQERFRAISTAYYRDAKAAFIVYDITKKETFETIPKWLKEIREQGEPGMPIMCCGNKLDLAHIRDVSEKEGKDFATKNKLLWMETSACEGTGVDEAFMSVVEELFKATKSENKTNHGKPDPKSNSTPIVIVNDGGHKKSDGGCQC